MPPKLKSRKNIILGDCVEVMKTFPDNHVDTIITDPSYGLGVSKKKWTYDLPSPDVWLECLRVLKPGGTMLCFSGSRTQHRVACAIEDAGFVIKDCIMWLYGCYSSDTECLTKTGWKSYKELLVGDKILQWNPKSGELSWYSLKELFVYDHTGDMIELSNRHTEQLLTPNHNVYSRIRKHSRNPKPEVFERIEAQKLKTHWLKDLPLAGTLKRGVTESRAYIIGWWLTDAWVHGDGKACMFSQSKIATLDKLRKVLLNENCKVSEYTKTPRKETHMVEHTFYVRGELAEYLLLNFPKRKLTWDVMSWDFESRHALLEGLLDGDGSRKGELDYAESFWSKKKSRLDLVQALCLSLNIRSHIGYKKGVVYLNRKHNTTQLQSKHGIGKKTYNGPVWCLKTETGAFVVRRNGKAFISGNSGFPKALDISKQFDKKAGKKQETTYVPNNNNAVFGATKGGGVSCPNQPNTAEAKMWNGWKSHALKPAYEPILVVIKPNDDTYLDNAIKHGVSGLNIDGSRIDYKSDDDREKSISSDHSESSYCPDENAFNPLSGSKARKRSGGDKRGRYPSNVIIDEETAEMLDAQSGTVKGGKYKSNADVNRTVKDEYFNLGTVRKSGAANYGDSGGASRFFYCAKASVSEKKAGCESLKSKKNCHPTVKPIRLIEYLCMLTKTPTGGLVLDPFAGSGTIGVACVNVGREFILIEKDPDYIPIIKARIKHARNNK
ncbi:hypothetical protein KAR91_62535 [Candidatus Pacearchaeota archaeon]|nr:hypothetical protein [Candidatus Pacearchaeota archaeon]